MSTRSTIDIPRFSCQVKFSTGLLCLSALNFGSAIVFILLAALDSSLQVLGVSAIVCLAWWALRRQLRETISLTHGNQGWEAVYHRRSAAAIAGVVSLDGKRCLLWPWLIVLYAPYSRAVLIPKDSVSSEDFRRIQVRLRANPY